MLLEEGPETRPAPIQEVLHLILLSARDQERLQELIQRFWEYLREPHASDLSLADIAYTLQVGRDAMTARVALCVSSLTELREKCEQILQGQRSGAGIYWGSITSPTPWRTDPVSAETLKQLFDQQQLEKLAQLWIEGVTLDWSSLHTGKPRQRLRLPTYPFARERCWPSPLIDKVPPDPAAATQWLPLLTELQQGTRSLEDVAHRLAL